MISKEVKDYLKSLLLELEAGSMLHGKLADSHEALQCVQEHFVRALQFGASAETVKVILEEFAQMDEKEMRDMAREHARLN